MVCRTAVIIIVYCRGKEEKKRAEQDKEEEEMTKTGREAIPTNTRVPTPLWLSLLVKLLPQRRRISSHL